MRFILRRSTKKKEQQDNEGVLVGIGVSVVQDESGYIRIKSVYANSPASESGLQANDLITKSRRSGRHRAPDMKKLPEWCRVRRVTKVKITYRRAGEDKEMELTRKKVEMPSVSYRMIDKTDILRFLPSMRQQ